MADEAFYGGFLELWERRHCRRVAGESPMKPLNQSSRTLKRPSLMAVDVQVYFFPQNIAIIILIICLKWGKTLLLKAKSFCALSGGVNSFS